VPGRVSVPAIVVVVEKRSKPPPPPPPQENQKHARKTKPLAPLQIV